MTEAEWLRENEPWQLVPSLDGKVSQRKLALYACACARHVWPLLKDRRSRRGVEIAEQHLEGSAERAILLSARSEAEKVQGVGAVVPTADVDVGYVVEICRTGAWAAWHA